MAVVRLKPKERSVSTLPWSTLGGLVDDLRKAKLYKVPVDVYGAAEFLGLELSREIMDDDISGYLEFRGGRWVVGVNAFHHEVRQRFTAAHEIAHYILHRDQKEEFRDVTFARRSSTRDTTEKEADAFASEFLMPEDVLRADISGGTTDLDDLSKRFQVSAMAMKYRLQALGYVVTQHD